MRLKFYQGLEKLEDLGFVFTKYQYKDDRPSFIYGDNEICLNIKRTDDFKSLKAIHKNKKVKNNDYFAKPKYEIYTFIEGCKTVLDIDTIYYNITKKKTKNLAKKLNTILDNQIPTKVVFGIKLENFNCNTNNENEPKQ